jgi:hypothetical protein
MQISFEILLLSKRASRYVNNSIELQDMKANYCVQHIILLSSRLCQAKKSKKVHTRFYYTFVQLSHVDMLWSYHDLTSFAFYLLFIQRYLQELSFFHVCTIVSIKCLKRSYIFFIKFGNNVEGRKISNESCHLFSFKNHHLKCFLPKTRTWEEVMKYILYLSLTCLFV